MMSCTTLEVGLTLEFSSMPACTEVEVAGTSEFAGAEYKEFPSAVRVVDGGNSASRSLATIAPSTETVPSWLTVTAPAGTLTGTGGFNKFACSAKTADPSAVVSCPLGAT